MTASALVEPAYWWAPDYHRTLGPEVGEVAALAGFAPDPEQQLVLDAQFGFDKKGKRVAFEVVVICARQNLKTGLFKIGALGDLFILEHRLVVWSAHEFGTAQEAFRDMCQLIESCPDLDREVKQIHRGNGDEAIELKGDRRLRFKARTKGGGRGLTGDDVILDEGFALQPAHMGALLPTLSAVADPQVRAGSSPGLADSGVLRGMRDRGRAGGQRSMVYAEWCDDLPGGCADGDDCDHALTRSGCRLDDEARYLRANPALGRRITIDHLRAERQALPPAEFARERLGWWDEPGLTAIAFGAGRWAACGVDDSSIAGDLTFGLAVSIDRRWFAFVAAGLSPDGLVHVEPVIDGDRSFHPGVVIAHAKRLQERHGGTIVIDGKGPASSLIPDLEDAGVLLRVLDLNEVLDAYATTYDLVQAKGLAHMSYPELDRAVEGAVPRPVGDRTTWGRKQSSADISPLEAMTLAVGHMSRPEPELTPSFAYR